MKSGHVAVITLTLMLLGSLAVAGPPARIYIYPGNISLIPCAQQQFHAAGLDALGNKTDLTESVTWSTDPTAGTITSSGLFTAGTSPGLYGSAVRATTASGLSAVAIVNVLIPTVHGGFMLERALECDAPGQLFDNRDLAFDSSGRLHVTGRDVVQVFDTLGNYVSMWRHTAQVITFADGFFYTKNPGIHYRIHKVDLQGDIVATWGSPGTGNGQFSGISDIAVDAEGNMFVCDANNDRVQKLDSSGNFVLMVGSKGTGDGQFEGPVAVTLDSAGKVYVLDGANNNVQKFDSQGNFIKKWGSTGQANGQFSSPRGIAVGPGDTIYVADYGNYRIQKFDSEGNFISSWTAPSPFYPVNIAVDAEGCSYATESQNRCVTKFGQDGTVIAKWGQPQEGQFIDSLAVACGATGEIYLARYDALCVFDRSLGLSAIWPGIFAWDIASDTPGTLFMTTGNGLRRYDISGNDLGSFASGSYHCVASDQQGNVYACDGQAVKKFDAVGNLVATIGSSVHGDMSQPWSLYGIAVDSERCVYATDPWGAKIRKFESTGQLVAEWQTCVPEPVQYIMPSDVCVDAADKVYVADTMSSRILVFDSSGTYLTQTRTGDETPAPYYAALAIDVDADGNIVTAGSRRLTKMTPVATSPGTAKTIPDGRPVSLVGQIVTAGSSQLGDCFYVESPDRSSGVKVIGKTAEIGASVLIQGITTTSGGEKAVEASLVAPIGSGSVEPVAMNNKTIGGIGLWKRNSQNEWTALSGVTNVGLLIKTWGNVVSRDQSTQTFLIDDGTAGQSQTKCSAPSGVTLPEVGTFVSVTGISSVEVDSEGYAVPLLKVRTQSDIIDFAP